MSLDDTARRIRSSHARSPGEVFANRAVSGASTVGVGGSLAYIATYYLGLPEELHAHAVALVIFLWNTLVFVISFFWRRKFGQK